MRLAIGIAAGGVAGFMLNPVSTGEVCEFRRFPGKRGQLQVCNTVTPRLLSTAVGAALGGGLGYLVGSMIERRTWERVSIVLSPTNGWRVSVGAQLPVAEVIGN